MCCSPLQVRLPLESHVPPKILQARKQAQDLRPAPANSEAPANDINVTRPPRGTSHAALARSAPELLAKLSKRALSLSAKKKRKASRTPRSKASCTPRCTKTPRRRKTWDEESERAWWSCAIPPFPASPEVEASNPRVHKNSIAEVPPPSLRIPMLWVQAGSDEQGPGGKIYM